MLVLACLLGSVGRFRGPGGVRRWGIRDGSGGWVVGGPWWDRGGTVVGPWGFHHRKLKTLTHLERWVATFRPAQTARARWQSAAWPQELHGGVFGFAHGCFGVMLSGPG